MPIAGSSPPRLAERAGEGKLIETSSRCSVQRWVMKPAPAVFAAHVVVGGLPVPTGCTQGTAGERTGPGPSPPSALALPGARSPQQPGLEKLDTAVARYTLKSLPLFCYWHFLLILSYWSSQPLFLLLTPHTL